jgi:1,4-alpha-glucan branching enzyme
MKKLNKGGVWEVYVDKVATYDKYKYEITSKNNKTILKADPYAFYQETNGKTASMVYDIEGYKWQDKKYLENLNKKDILVVYFLTFRTKTCSWASSICTILRPLRSFFSAAYHLQNKQQ